MKFSTAMLVFHMLIRNTASQDNAIPFLGSIYDSAFDPPDLTAIVDISTGHYQLEAFKCKNNDNILTGTSLKMSSQLSWVSIGMPEFVPISSPQNPNVSSLFYPIETGFLSNIEMLTDSQREILASVASDKYNITFSRANIINMILSKFVCTLTIPTQKHKQVVVTGKVSSFHTFPLVMKFPALANKKTLFNKAVKNFDVEFHCDIESKEYMTEERPPLTMSREQPQYTALMKKLFAAEEQTESATNRAYIESVGRGMYNALDIEKNYKMTFADFVRLFADDLISQVSVLPVSNVLCCPERTGQSLDGETQGSAAIRKQTPNKHEKGGYDWRNLSQERNDTRKHVGGLCTRRFDVVWLAGWLAD